MHSKHCRTCDRVFHPPSLRNIYCPECRKARDVSRQSAANKAFYAANQEQQRARAKKWRAANPERHAAATQAWREANAERFKQIHQAWRLANLERAKAKRRENYALRREIELAQGREYKKKNKAKIAERAAAYLKANPEYNRFMRSLRRAAEKVAMPKWVDRKAIRALYAEAVRLTAETGIVHHVDHIVPLQSKLVCGLHVPCNLQVIPGDQNMSKSNRHWPDMAPAMEAA